MMLEVVFCIVWIDFMIIMKLIVVVLFEFGLFYIIEIGVYDLVWVWFNGGFVSDW